MTEHEIEKLQRGIEAALRDLNALNFGATILKGDGSATVAVHPKAGYETESEPREQEKIADDLRIELIGRGYDVTSEVVPPGGTSRYYSFQVRGH